MWPPPCRAIGQEASNWTGATWAASNYRAAWKKDYKRQEFAARGPSRKTASDQRTHRDRRRLHVGDGRVGGLLEGDRFPGGGVGDELAQQLVVQLVTGLVAAEFTDEAVAKKIE